jgi:hypothetical protein
MKRVIFTTFDDIEVKSDFDNANALLVKEYFDRLIKNKSDYADNIGVDFKFFHNTMGNFDVPGELEFTKVNLHKHHLMAQLAEEYDEVMYVDMDVIFNTDENVFEVHDLSKGIHVKDQDVQIKSKDNQELLLIRTGLRSPTLKYHITKDMLNGRDNHVINTGVIIGKSDHIKQIKFIERMPDMISLLQQIKENNLERSDTSYIRKYYYANNEAFFSYILENYSIPYVILEDAWHTFFYNSHPKDALGCQGKILHFINKKFNTFFNDKTKCIFSLYIKIEDDQLDNPPTNKIEPLSNKSKRTQLQFEKYYDDLIADKKEYAENIGADFILFENDENYQEFRKRFPTLSEYDIVNLYKIYCLDQLTKQYDLVCYLDFDVYCRRKDVDIFENVPCEYAIACEFKSKDELGIKHDLEYFNTFIVDFRSPHAKYWNAHALLSEEELEPDVPVFNTGIIAASRYVMEKIDYFSDIDEVLEKMTELREDEFSMYPEKIRLSFGYDNETIFAYKARKNNLLTYNLWNPLWHGKHLLRHIEAYDKIQRETTPKGRVVVNDFKSWCDKKQPIFVHFISKQFGLVFDK